MAIRIESAAIVASAIVIGGALVNLAREVSRLAVVVDGLGASVEMERKDRKEADASLQSQINMVRESR